MSENKKKTDDSRPTTRKRLKFSYFEPVAGIIFAIVATVIFYFFPQIIGVFFIGGRVIPTFDAEVIRSLWIPIFLWAILRIGVEVAYLVERRYTRRLAVITIIGNVLAAIAAIIIFINPRIVYWEYIDFIHSRFDNLAEWFANILASPHIVIIVIIIVVLIIDAISVILRGNKAKRLEDEAKEDEEVVYEEVTDEADTPEVSSEVETAVEETAEEVSEEAESVNTDEENQ